MSEKPSMVLKELVRKFYFETLFLFRSDCSYPIPYFGLNRPSRPDFQDTLEYITISQCRGWTITWFLAHCRQQLRLVEELGQFPPFDQVSLPVSHGWRGVPPSECSSCVLWSMLRSSLSSSASAYPSWGHWIPRLKRMKAIQFPNFRADMAESIILPITMRKALYNRILPSGVRCWYRVEA